MECRVRSILIYAYMNILLARPESKSIKHSHNSAGNAYAFSMRNLIFHSTLPLTLVPHYFEL
jgi:hypothetical protein